MTAPSTSPQGAGDVGATSVATPERAANDGPSLAPGALGSATGGENEHIARAREVSYAPCGPHRIDELEAATCAACAWRAYHAMWRAAEAIERDLLATRARVAEIEELAREAAGYEPSLPRADAIPVAMRLIKRLAALAANPGEGA